MAIKKFSDWGLFAKIFSLVLICIVPIVLFIVIYILPTMRAHLLDEKQAAIKNIVDVGYDIIAGNEAKIASNSISLEEAQKNAKDQLRAVRYAGEEYFWICDNNLTMVMHPFKPELIGKDISNIKDPDGKYLFRECVETAKNAAAGGLVNYMWAKPGKTEPVPKITYVRSFDKWGWVLGSGIYVDDVEAEFAAMSWKIYLSLFAFLAVILISSYFFTKLIVNVVKKLNEAANKIASGDYNIELDIKSKDEFGALASVFNKMVDKIEIQIKYLENLPAPVMIMDTDYNITYINKKGAEIAGIKQSESKNKKCYDLFKNEHCNTSECRIRQAMQFREVRTGETVVRPQGKEMHIMYTGAPVTDKTGKLIGALEYVADITNIKESQNYLVRSTNNLLIEMDKFADGDLTVSAIPEVQGDQIASLFEGFNRVVENIKQIINRITEAVQATASASNEISASTEQMAAGAQEQSAQTSEVATAVEQMTKTILETSKNSVSASEAAKNAGAIAHEGGKVVSETINGMNRIAEVVNKSADTVKELGKSSDQIGEIIQVIDDIADQTNLLALNAAIEAARAGEQGRGFAVVADEVRKLAERTTKATKEIEAMIKQIQKDTEGAVVSMQLGTQEVEKGKELADRAGQSLKQIIKGTEDVVGISTQVAAASEEQSSVAEQISKNIEGINNVTQESTSGVQQIARASEDLNRLTINLQELVSKFKVDSSSIRSSESYHNVKPDNILASKSSKRHKVH